MYNYNLEVSRDHGYFRMYADNGNYRVYWGMTLVYDGDDHGAAHRAYNRKGEYLA